jgi:hypothetical protein
MGTGLPYDAVRWSPPSLTTSRVKSFGRSFRSANLLDDGIAVSPLHNLLYLSHVVARQHEEPVRVRPDLLFLDAELDGHVTTQGGRLGTVTVAPNHGDRGRGRMPRTQPSALLRQGI